MDLRPGALTFGFGDPSLLSNTETAEHLLRVIADALGSGTSHVYPEDWDAVTRAVKEFFETAK